MTIIFFNRLGYLLLVCAAVLQAQTAAPKTSPPEPQPGISKQKSAIAAMEESIAKQRMSVRKQVDQETSDSFFVLPPPERTASTQRTEISGAEFDCPPLPGDQVRSLASQAAARQDVDPDLLVSVMKTESAFRPCAVSSKGAMGLMQLMPSTADQLGVEDSFDPLQNVSAGAKLLKELLSRYNGDVVKAVSAYNAGPARVDALGGIPPIPETIEYVNRVLDLPANRQSGWSPLDH